MSLTAVALLFSLRRDGYPVGRYLLSIAPVLFILAFAYGNSRRHVGVLFPMAIVVFGFFGNHRRLPRAFIPMVFFMLSATALWLHTWRPDRNPPASDFSGSGELIQFQGQLLSDQNVVLVVNVDHSFFAIMGRLDISVFDARRDRFLHFSKFARSEIVYTLNQWCQIYQSRLAEKFPGKKVVFGIAGRPGKTGLPLPAKCGPAQEIFQTSRPIQTDESYALFLASPP